MSGPAKLAEKGPIYIELYDALAHFLGRQQLAARAVADQGVAVSDLSKGVAGWYDKTPSRGMWGDSWRFGFHGGGCELKHVETGEPIDLNTPDPARLSLLSFVYHLEWRLSRDTMLPLLRAFVEERGTLAVLELIEDLTADGLITADYRLTPLPGSTQATAA